MYRRLILLRHGQTHYNATRRMQGQLDTRLDDVGREQAALAAERFVAADISRIIASDLERASDTATIIGDRIGVPVETDARLRETDLGAWQGCTHTEIDVEDPDARLRWRNDATWAPPGGESRLDVARRARPVVDDLIADFGAWPGSSVLLVAHSGTISALTSHLLGLDVTQYPLLTSLHNTAAAVLTDRAKVEDEPDDQWYLQAWNLGGRV